MRVDINFNESDKNQSGKLKMKYGELIELPDMHKNIYENIKHLKI